MNNVSKHAHIKADFSVTSMTTLLKKIIPLSPVILNVQFRGQVGCRVIFALDDVITLVKCLKNSKCVSNAVESSQIFC